MPPAKLGLVYSHTGLRRSSTLSGRPARRELFLLGRNVDADTALLWGLVNRVCPEQSWRAKTLELAGELAGNAPLSQRGNKRVIRELLERRAPGSDRTRRAADRAAPGVVRLEDMREGIRAFGERRPPAGAAMNASARGQAPTVLRCRWHR